MMIAASNTRAVGAPTWWLAFSRIGRAAIAGKVAATARRSGPRSSAQAVPTTAAVVLRLTPGQIQRTARSPVTDQRHRHRVVANQDGRDDEPDDDR